MIAGRKSHELERPISDAVYDVLADVLIAEAERLEREAEREVSATQGRTGVERDGYSREIVVVPELEVPTRFAKAVAALASSLMAMGYTERAALDVVARVGRDSMPQVRVLVLQHLIEAEPTATAHLSNVTNLPVSTVRLVAEDLTAIGLVERQGTGQALRWSLTSDGVTTTKALAIRKDTPNTKSQGRDVYTPPLPLCTDLSCFRGGFEMP